MALRLILHKSLPIQRLFLYPCLLKTKSYISPPLAAEGAMCIFHTFEKNAFKDLQPPEKSGLQYKCLVLILKMVYDCIVSNEISSKQFSLEIKSYSPFLEIALFTVQ